MSLLKFAALGLGPKQKGFAYTLGGKLYLAVTNSCSMCETTLIETRGKSFQIPQESGFQALDESYPEPTSLDLSEIVNRVYETTESSMGSMGEKDQAIVFAGLGEPLSKVDIVLDTVSIIKEQRNGLRFRVNTNGLHSSDSGVVRKLIDSGVVASDDSDQRRETRIDCISVALMCDNPKTYDDIMKPGVKGGRSFGDVCNFISSLAEAGVNVECTAVERPEVNLANTKKLAMALGARDFRTRKLHKQEIYTKPA